MSPGRVVFVGGGPGAPDLLTLRAARELAEADIVIWGRSLLMEEAVRQHIRAGAEVIAWPPAKLSDVLAAYDRARDEGLRVVRLKSGDPTLFGEMAPELEAVRERGLAFDVVPGVSSVTAAAAALRFELAQSGEPVLLSATPRHLTRSRGTAALLVAGSRSREVQDGLLAAGYPPQTACGVAHRVSWPGEVLLTCPLAELAERVGDLGLDGLTLFVAGRAVELADPAG
jgi:precorrin-4/cobalt-precorrin-4 C11-methyltransferase